MAPLTAFFICSLDLRVADSTGGFGWAEPPEDVHAFANDRERPVGTHLCGRRMWETMRFWETMPDEDSVPCDFGRVWRGVDKVVYSTTLADVDAPRTRLERRFDPEAVRRLKAEATAPLTVGGAELAGHAFRAGLVDHLELLLAPVLVGEGPRALPEGSRSRLTLVEQRTFPAGWVHLHYVVGADG
ncbi:MAG: dihydrofolate reductase family protein [Acidobacteria bacterium]|nr:dihydrofolate reductase family protein [Acidobacteriota bacterium]